MSEEETTAPAAAVVVDASPAVSSDPVPALVEDDTPAPRVRFEDDVAGSSRGSGRMSTTSKHLVDSSRLLLDMKPSVAPVLNEDVLELMKQRSNSPDTGDFSGYSSRFSALSTPRFKRIDFDDRIDEAVEDRKPPWKQWQESVKDSYYKAKRTVERNKEASEFLDQQLNRTKPRHRRAESPFHNLDGESFLPRKSSWFENGAMEPRGLRPSSSASSSNVFTDMAASAYSSPYAAPAVASSQGIESGPYSSRYEKRANDVEARLLRTINLPERMKTLTTKDFRNAPKPSPGSATEQDLDDAESSIYFPRPYYSRPTRRDPDYFDFDLNHSVDLYRRPEGKYTPRGPQGWENKLLDEARSKGDAPLSGYLFTKGESDWRANGTSYLSAALRTPKFWEQRFESIGREVRESNPVSLDSINRSKHWLPTVYWYLARNKPVPSRFTEYRDPDFEDYEDPRDDDD